MSVLESLQTLLFLHTSSSLNLIFRVQHTFNTRGFVQVYSPFFDLSTILITGYEKKTTMFSHIPLVKPMLNHGSLERIIKIA